MVIYSRFVDYATKAYVAVTTMAAGYELFRAIEFCSDNKSEEALGSLALGGALLFAAALPRMIRRQDRIDAEKIEEHRLNRDSKVVYLRDAKKPAPLEDRLKAHRQ